jgi:ERCC4-type nuclease
VSGRLDAGDFQFFPHGLKVLIERKTVSDLLNSLKSARLVTQAHKLIEQSDAAILLIEGLYSRSKRGYVEYEQGSTLVESGWSWDAFTGMMLDLKWMGLYVHECYHGEAAREIARIVGSLCAEQHAWIRSRERPSVITVDPQYKNAVWALCSFGGVGPEWADAILKDQGNFAQIVCAGADQLAQVKNRKGQSFGHKRAARLVEEFEQQWTTG